MTGYKLYRADCSGWLFCGTTPKEVGDAVKNEIEGDGGLPCDECDQILIRPFEITQEEIDNMPEFEGW